MKISRRSFLGGAVGALALMFGGFGWKEPQLWDQDEGLTVEKLAEIHSQLTKQIVPVPTVNGKYLCYINHRVTEEIRMDFL